MKVEVRLNCGVLVGTMEIAASIFENNQVVKFPVPRVGAFAVLELPIGRWRNWTEGTEKRAFKVTLDEIGWLRSTRGFEEDAAFSAYRIEDLLVREKIATRAEIESLMEPEE